MRRKRKNRGDIIIDLTSLLDVIFIVLLVVMCGQQGVTATLNETVAEAAETKAQAETTKALYDDMISMENSLQKLVWAASISVPYDKSEITKREIKVLVEGKELESFPLIGNDVEESFDNFQKFMAEYIEDNEDKPVILSLNEEDDKILYRDEMRISEIIKDLLSGYDNVYIKGNIGEEE